MPTGLTGSQVRRLFPDLQQAALALDRAYPVVEQWSDERWALTIAGQVVQDIGESVRLDSLRDRRQQSAALQRSGANRTLIDLADVCREINQRMTVLARILELSGAPIAVLENVNGSDGIAVGPGAKWELPEGARAYLLDLLQGGSSQIHLAYVDHLFRVLHDLSETPADGVRRFGPRSLRGGAGGRDPAAGAEGRADAPDVGRRVRTAQRDAARPAGAVRRARRCTASARPPTIWPPILPSDRDGAVRNAVSLVESGIQSRRSAIVTLGSNDPDAELAQIREERDLTGQRHSGGNV